MKRTVHAISVSYGLVAILTDHGEYTIAAPLAGHADVGDRVDGPLQSLGRQDLTNLTRRRGFRAFIEDWSCDAATARSLLSAK